MSAANESVPKPDEDEPKAVKKFARRYGSRYEVFDSGLAEMTRGGLRKGDLMLSRTGKIVSKKKSASAKALYEQYCFKKRVAKPDPEPKKKRKRRKKAPAAKKSE